MKHTRTLLISLLWAFHPALHATDDLVVYPPVPGLAASEHYTVRVRSRVVGSKWQSAFAWQTTCKAVEKKTDASFDTLAGCTRKL